MITSEIPTNVLPTHPLCRLGSAEAKPPLN